MTVKELIEKLKEYPDNMPVYFSEKIAKDSTSYKPITDIDCANGGQIALSYARYGDRIKP
jgi:hypothetical protein